MKNVKYKRCRFTIFIIVFISFIVILIQELIAQCNNTFQYLVAEAFVQCTLPILRDSKDFKEYMEVLNECITFILEDLSWMSSKTSPQQFICWNIINSSCPDFDLEGFSENLEWLSTVGSSIINRNLCKIYMEHRSPEQLQSAEGKRWEKFLTTICHFNHLLC